jgi:hypothetical protein
LHKSGEKILKINFNQENNFLVVVISDNGIGRQRSYEINKVKNNLHKPFASEANLARIDILNQGKEKVGVMYNDKNDDLGVSFGTTVTLKILLE